MVGPVSARTGNLANFGRVAAVDSRVNGAACHPSRLCHANA